VPDYLSGRVSFPGLKNYTTARYTCGHGIGPGLATVTVALSPDVVALKPDQVDDLDLTDGESSFTLRDCRIVTVSLLGGGVPQMVQVDLQDRRWKWQYGHVSGAYNVRDAQGRIIQSSRTRIKRLAELCLEALGEDEDRWDLSAMPDPDFDEALPAVNWDYTPPAQALDDLASRVGCRVIYRPIDDSVMVAPPGTGEDFPDGDAEWAAPGVGAKPQPEMLRAVGAPALFVGTLVLEPVGEELDGSVVPIDELSYKPRNGWAAGNTGLNLRLDPHFGAKGKTLRDCVAAATKSVFRWFRVTIRPVSGDTFTIPGLDQFEQADGGPAEVVDAEQLMPLDRIIGAERDEEKKLFSDPAYVWGVIYATQMAHNTKATRLTVPFSVDTDRGLVFFDREMIKSNLTGEALKPAFGLGGGAGAVVAAKIDPNKIGPADLVLVCSLMVRDRKTRQPIRYSRDRKLGGQAGVIQVVRCDDVQFSHFVQHDTQDKLKIQDEKDNKDEADQAADHYLDAEAQLLEPTEAGSRKYPRLVAIDPDGAIQEVAWECSGRVSTTISRNTTRATWLPLYEVRRGQERAKVLLRDLQALISRGGIIGLAGRAAGVGFGFNLGPPPG
jgi:hypothetical protein